MSDDHMSDDQFDAYIEEVLTTARGPVTAHAAARVLALHTEWKRGALTRDEMVIAMLRDLVGEIERMHKEAVRWSMHSTFPILARKG